MQIRVLPARLFFLGIPSIHGNGVKNASGQEVT